MYYKILSVIILATFFVKQSNVSAQDTLTLTKEELNISLEWFVCVEPDEERACVCLKEDDKSKACPNCKKWKKEFSSETLALELNKFEYSFEEGKGFPRANFFARDLAYQVYDSEYPKTEYGYPVTTGVFYSEYESFDWVSLDEEDKKIGSMIIFPSFVGIVTSDSSGILEVLYPRGKQNGELVTRKFTFDYFSKFNARYVVPKNLVRNK